VWSVGDGEMGRWGDGEMWRWKSYAILVAFGKIKWKITCAISSWIHATRKHALHDRMTVCNQSSVKPHLGETVWISCQQGKAAAQVLKCAVGTTSQEERGFGFWLHFFSKETDTNFITGYLWCSSAIMMIFLQISGGVVLCCVAIVLVGVVVWSTAAHNLITAGV
jgi:hypothetical protein